MKNDNLMRKLKKERNISQKYMAGDSYSRDSIYRFEKKNQILV